jgi:hypothetical protein
MPGTKSHGTGHEGSRFLYLEEANAIKIGWLTLPSSADPTMEAKTKWRKKSQLGHTEHGPSCATRKEKDGIFFFLSIYEEKEAFVKEGVPVSMRCERLVT